ncbi:MAG: T9SS type A sorting domain-containing protein, partial [Candidatus Cloacimonetes bacterium]|nr:T9SS type A sorting domain-containing protein [Candidatus Cloacimonadota bacterium]
LPFGYDLPEFDLAGNVRTYNDSIDIGAYEWNGEGIENYEFVITNYRISNYPNPFNPTTTISFSLTTEITVDTEIIIYNLKGQKVKNLPITLSGDEGAGIWNGTDNSGQSVSSGIYFYKLGVGDLQQVNKMMLLK